MSLDWPTVIGVFTVLGSLILAVGGFIKNRGDVKVGVRSATREDQAAWDARYQQIFDEVRESLVDPLKAEVARLRDEVAQLRSELSTERAEHQEERARYRAALTHIRAWRAWAALNAAHDAEPVPVPSPRIADDLH